MQKKYVSSLSPKQIINEIKGFSQPVFHQKSECYVSFSCFDPASGKMRLKKIRLGHIKGKKNQRVYADLFIGNLTRKLMSGWNPFVTVESFSQYSLWNDVVKSYRIYLQKVASDDGYREETIISYTSRLRILENWIENHHINLYYAYQFNEDLVTKFLEYVWIDRNNSIRTRNNYMVWLKQFSHFLLLHHFISIDPTANLLHIKRREKTKNRDIIPDNILIQIQQYLQIHNRYFLLACYMLHYLFIRPHEMTFVKIGDISVKKQTIMLHGDHCKNHEDAVVTIPENVMKLMIDLNIFIHPSQDYLFSSVDFRPGKRQKSDKSFRDYWVKHLRKDLQFSIRYKFYSLKDTGITNMLRANTDILSVRDQARHSSILITDTYTPKDIKAANKYLMNYKGVF
jgi:integrase